VSKKIVGDGNENEEVRKPDWKPESPPLAGFLGTHQSGIREDGF
jgi:hypothetical protein